MFLINEYLVLLILINCNILIYLANMIINLFDIRSLLKEFIMLLLAKISYAFSYS